MKDQASSLRKLFGYSGSKTTASPVSSHGQPSAPQTMSASQANDMIETGGGHADVHVGLSPEGSGRARIIAITSGKGGVGKTNLTVNLAIAMGKIGRRAMIIDADLGMANVDVVLGTVSKHHLLHLLQPDVTLADVLIRGPYGVNYISGGSAIERAVDFTPQERKCLMDKLAACESMADIVLVDTGAGLGNNVLDFILAADEVVLVTTPEPTALTDAYAVIKTYSMRSDKKNLKIVVNRVTDKEEGNEVLSKLRRTSEKFLSMPLPSLGVIYEDSSVMKAVKRQTPLLAAYPDAVSARCIEAVAKNVLYGGQHEIRQGWKGFLQRLLNF